jgi:hypothetical protein
MTDGVLCTSTAEKKSGYCKQHNPAYALVPDKELAEIQRKEAKREAEKKAKKEQRMEIQTENIREAILEINDVESLRRLELLVLQGLIDGTVDGRAGSSIVGLLKHQQELLRETEGTSKDNLSASERDALLRRAGEMSLNDMLETIGDFQHAFKRMTKQAKIDAQVVEATEVKVIDEHV